MQRLLAAIAAVVLLLAIYLYVWTRRAGRDEPKFTTEAERVIAFARVEAQTLESAAIDSTHFLLGLLHIPIPAITRFIPLEWHDSIRQEIRDHVSGGAIVSYRDDLPFTDDARLVLVAAAREAKGLSSLQIGAEHLLLGLLHSEKSLAALILRERGLRLEALRAAYGGWEE
ncbi:MAG TPA: Clp protease N-terminal domain-containing protein [Terriglobales bacterium]|nr:Clp protease N-terminal domain-containing protein [Terriglobales bacterium]